MAEILADFFEKEQGMGQHVNMAFAADGGRLITVRGLANLINV